MILPLPKARSEMPDQVLSEIFKFGSYFFVHFLYSYRDYNTSNINKVGFERVCEKMNRT